MSETEKKIVFEKQDYLLYYKGMQIHAHVRSTTGIENKANKRAIRAEQQKTAVKIFYISGLIKSIYKVMQYYSKNAWSFFKIRRIHIDYRFALKIMK